MECNFVDSDFDFDDLFVTVIKPAENFMKPAKLRRDVDRETVIRSLKRTLNYSKTRVGFTGLELVTSKNNLRKLCRQLFVDGDKYYKKLVRTNGYLRYIPFEDDNSLIEIDSECVMYPIVDFMKASNVEDFGFDFERRRMTFKIKGRKTWIE